MYTEMKTMAICALAGLCGVASANLVQNGGFEQTTLTGSSQITNTGTVSNWSTNGFNFLFKPGTADSTGAINFEEPVALTLWGPNSGSNNGLKDSPSGGNWIAADGGYEVGAIVQTINNLVVGQKYQLSFDWAAAQQSGYYGPTTEKWIVSLGAQAFSTPILSTASQGFQSWRQQVFTYTATSTSEVLSFLAAGTPIGNPPFSLLDNVQLNAVQTNAVPEPDSLPLAFTGLGLVALASRRRSTLQRAA